MLNSAKVGNLAAGDWGYVALIATQSQTLLRSLDNVTEHLDKNDHDNAFQKVVVASTSSKSIESNSKRISHSTVKSYAKKVSTAADGLVNNLLNSEVSYYTERAQALKASNYLEAVKAYGMLLLHTVSCRILRKSVSSISKLMLFLRCTMNW
jgi:hypothetical protein